jgi:hypothetical protein
LIVGIHQPNFLPWLGFFNKIKTSDVFVLIDQVQFVKGSYCNRLKYKKQDGESAWLTIPVQYSLGQNFQEVTIVDINSILKKTKSVLQSNYAKAPFYKEISTALIVILEREFQNLAELNVALIEWVCDGLSLETRLLRQSAIEKQFGKNNELTAGLTAYLGGDVYLSGTGAKKYNDPELFEEQGLKLIYQEYTQPSFNQVNGEFVGGISVLDALMNVGFEGVKELI